MPKPSPTQRLLEAEREIASLRAEVAELRRQAPAKPPAQPPVVLPEPLPELRPDVPHQVTTGSLQGYSDDPLHDPRVVPLLARHGMQHPETQAALRQVVNEYANDPSRQARAREAMRMREQLERSDAARASELLSHAIPLGLSPDPRTHPGSQQRTTGEIPWESYPEHRPEFIRQIGVRTVPVALDRAGPWPASIPQPQPQPAIAGPRTVQVTGSEFPSLPAHSGAHDDEVVWAGIAGAATQPAGESPE